VSRTVFSSHLPPSKLPPPSATAAILSSMTGPPPTSLSASSLLPPVTHATAQNVVVSSAPSATSTTGGATGLLGLADDTSMERKMKKCDLTVDRPFDAVIIVTQKELKYVGFWLHNRLM